MSDTFEPTSFGLVPRIAMRGEFESIRLRHRRLESMEETQSPDLVRELKSQAHKDRAWLIRALDAASEQNDVLSQELGRLEIAVDQLGAQPLKSSRRPKKESAE